MTESARFNPAALEMLQRAGGDELVGQMADLMESYGPGRLDAARSAAAAGDAPGVAFAAHSLKSSAAQLGGAALYEAALTAERAATAVAAGDGQRDALPPLVQIMCDEYTLFFAWLSAQRKPAASVTTAHESPAWP